MCRNVITGFVVSLCLLFMVGSLAAQTMTPPPTYIPNRTYQEPRRDTTSSRLADAKRRSEAEKALREGPDPIVEKAIAEKNYSFLLKRYEKDCKQAQIDLKRTGKLPSRATSFDKASQLVKGCHGLAQMYEKGEGVAADTTKAADLYRASARLGVTDSQDAAVRLSADPIKALEAFALDPEMGYDHRCYSTRKLATIYVRGDGVAKDLKQAVRWNRVCYDAAGKSIETYLPGYVQNGAFTLIDLYSSTDPDIRNLPEARTIALRLVETKAVIADKYRTLAQYLAGNLLYDPEAGVPDRKRGLDLLEKAAGAGYPEAMIRLSEIYAAGDGVRADVSKATEWLDNAVAAKNARAQHRKAQQAYTAKDMVMAKALWIEAAKQGYSDAQYALAQFFIKETAKTPNDLANAYVWLDVAAKNGHPEAAAARDALKPQLPDTLLKAAEAAEANLIKAFPKVIG